jgi:hypothetical protein
MPLKDLTGHRYGLLTVVKHVGVSAAGALWRCKCDCGGEKIVRANSLRTARTRSCGCLNSARTRKGIAIKHGHTKKGGYCSPTYFSWRAMIARCCNPNHEHYASYGGRGIVVCDRWRDFENFLSDMGERLIGTTLDRIDNDGNYEPGNCRWATAKQQRNNRRKRRVVVCAIA